MGCAATEHVVVAAPVFSPARPRIGKYPVGGRAGERAGAAKSGSFAGFSNSHFSGRKRLPALVLAGALAYGLEIMVDQQAPVAPHFGQQIVA